MFFLKSVMNKCDNDLKRKRGHCISDSGELTLLRRTSCIIVGVSQHQSSGYTRIIKSSAIFLLKTVMNVCANVFKRKRSQRDSDFSSDTTEEHDNNSSNKRRRLCDADPSTNTKEEISQASQQLIPMNTISLKRKRTQCLDDEKSPSKRRELDKTHGVSNLKAAQNLAQLWNNMKSMSRNYEKTFDMRLLCWHRGMRQQFQWQSSKLKGAFQNQEFSQELYPKLYVLLNLQAANLEFQD